MVGSNDTVLGGLVAAATLIALDRGFRALRDRSQRVREVVEGEPRILARDGRPMARALREEGITSEELAAAVRKHGLERVADAKLAILETDGSISVIPQDRRQGAEAPDEQPKAR